jgi:multiple sugar transport system substrate-binding protein
MEESLDAFKSGQVAMAMNWFAFFPGLAADPTVGGENIGFFVNPGPERGRLDAGRAGDLGRQLLRQPAGALDYIRWFAQPEVQQRWWELGGYPVHNAVLNDPGFVDSAPFRGRLPERDGRGAGLLAGAGLCRAAARHAEAPA